MALALPLAHQSFKPPCTAHTTYLHLQRWTIACCMQVLPIAAQWMTTSCGMLLMYGIGSPFDTRIFETTPQGACIILAAVGSAAAILMSLGVKSVSYRLRTVVAPRMAVKRMSLLGLVCSALQAFTLSQSTVHICFVHMHGCCMHLLECFLHVAPKHF